MAFLPIRWILRTARSDAVKPYYPPNPTLVALLGNERWLGDLTSLTEYTKLYARQDKSVRDAFQGVANFYANLLRSRSNLEPLAADTTALTQFLEHMFVLSQYGQQYDDTLTNTVNQLSAAMVDAAPELKDIMLTKPARPSRRHR